MALVNRLNGNKVRLFVSKARSQKGVAGLAEAAASQVGLTNVVVHASQITGYLRNGRLAILRPVSRYGHSDLVYDLQKGWRGPFRANVTYRIKTDA